MRFLGTSAVVAVTGLVVYVAPLAGQGYQLRLDTRVQSVSFWDANDQEVQGAPLMSTLDAAVWGFGLQGVSIRTRTRLGTDLNDPAVWPGTEPTLQLLEGFAEYASPLLTAQVGRTHVSSRLGWVGFDGARVDVRPGWYGLRLGAFGGWGMARGAALPVTSPTVNPLGDFALTERQLLVGGTLGWTSRLFDANLVYQREQLQTGANTALGGLRGAADMTFRPDEQLTVLGGAEYDFARSELNTAELEARYRNPRGLYQVGAGARYYRPYFDLWSIWGVFSPTPYSAFFGNLRVDPIGWLALHATAEAFQFEDADIAAPIARVTDDGWRWAIGGTITRWNPLAFGGTYYVEATNGASSLGWDMHVQYEPMTTLGMSAYAGYRRRPLEYRINDAKVWNYGLRVDYAPIKGVAVAAGALRLDETRVREFDTVEYGNWRFDFGLVLTYGSGADTPRLHPAILRIPEGRPQ